MPKKQKEKNGKLGLVVGTTPDRFELDDTRLMKPVCHQKYENGSLQGSMLIQDIDKVSLSKKGRNTNNYSSFSHITDIHEGTFKSCDFFENLRNKNEETSVTETEKIDKIDSSRNEERIPT